MAGEELRLDVLGTAPGSEVTLNGSVIKSAALSSGDRIQMGEATITLLNGPAPNPNRISAPPARGRDALSMAAAALGAGAAGPASPAGGSTAPAPAPPSPAGVPSPAGRYPEPRPRAYEARPDAVPARSDDRRPAPAGAAPVSYGAASAAAAAVPAAAAAVRGPEFWGEVFARLRRPIPLDERLQDLASYLASSTPVHSIAFLSMLESTLGEAVAAIWKGSLPRLGRRTLAEALEGGSTVDAFEGGMKVRIYPVVRPQAETVGLMVAPMEVAADPWLNEFLVQLAAVVGFVHAERAEPPLGERGTAPPAVPPPFALDDPLSAIVGHSLPIQNLKASLQRVASARAPILLVGDVGTGKTLVAETLHGVSPRRPRPLVRVAATASTAASLEEDLLGAAGPDRRRRPGRLFEADGGTLLIEEVGDLPAATQALLYRLLEAREVVAPGGRAVPVDVRVIATSSRPLTRAVEEGLFRDDLYYRLSALTLKLPALKDRKEDIPALLDAFAARLGGPPADRFDVEAMNALLNYSYPGNVREIENESRRLSVQQGPGPVTLRDLDGKFGEEKLELALAESDDLKEIVEKVERQVIERVMRKVRGNQSLGARLLNISRGSLIAKVKEYDIKDFRYLKRHGE